MLSDILNSLFGGPKVENMAHLPGKDLSVRKAMIFGIGMSSMGHAVGYPLVSIRKTIEKITVFLMGNQFFFAG